MEVNATKGVIIYNGSIYSIEDLPYLIEEFIPEDHEFELEEEDKEKRILKLLEEYNL